MSVNENQLQVEVLQPEVSPQVQQATADELKIWIRNGKLKPHHQVRIKNLSWIQAKNIPAFKTLFETVNTSPEINPEKIVKEHSPVNFIPENIVTEKMSPEKIAVEENSVISGKPIFLKADVSSENKMDSGAGEEKSKDSEPSLAFKLFEQKAAAKSRQKNAAVADVESDAKKPEPKIEPAGNSSVKANKARIIRNGAAFLIAVGLLFLLAYGATYLWIYQLKSPVKFDENSLAELSFLENKLTADKLDLRLKAAERERELKNATGQEQPVRPSNINQEIAKLDQQYALQRKDLIEAHRVKLQTADFNATLYFSFAVLLGVFVLVRVFTGKDQKPEAAPAPFLDPSDDEITDDEEDAGYVEPEFVAADSEDVETEDLEKISRTISTVTSWSENSNKSKPSEVHLRTIEGSAPKEFKKSQKCLLHVDNASSFVCENCDNYFCKDCPVVLDEKENCCPFCKVVCQPLAEPEEQPGAQKAEKIKKKKPQIPHLGKSKNVSSRIAAVERTNKVGVIPALIVALLFSFSNSILWVYKISPYLNEGKEVAQNNSPVSETASKNPTQSGTTANEPCTDPRNGQPFDCDEETRKTLEDRAAKEKTVDKKDSNPPVRQVSKNEPQTSPISSEPFGNERETQELIKVFLLSFVTIFGLLMSTRLFTGENK